jgi:4a-hydroxytetrahydrobiopterin dehydratase
MALLTGSETRRRLAGVPDWQLGEHTDEQAREIVRERQFADFAEAIAFVDRVAAAAEAVNHHPDILLHGWNKVRLTLSTHSEGGLTAADFELAAQLDKLA